DLDLLDPLYTTFEPRTLRTRCTLDFRALCSPYVCSATCRLPHMEVKFKLTANLDLNTNPGPHLAPCPLGSTAITGSRQSVRDSRVCWGITTIGMIWRNLAW